MTDLADFGLTVDDTVRWRRGSNGTWRYCTVKGVNKDGSLDLLGPQGFRAIMPDKIQRKERGPKGGTVWTPLQHGGST